MSVNLKEKYPKIFENIHRANYGFPEAWTNLVDNLCLEIQLYCNTHDCDQVQCVQVKEKFGGLRFYVNSATDEVYKMIRRAENRSIELCQECGCSNCELIRTKGWISYLCKPCAIKLNKEFDDN